MIRRPNAKIIVRIEGQCKSASLTCRYPQKIRGKILSAMQIETPMVLNDNPVDSVLSSVVLNPTPT